MKPVFIAALLLVALTAGAQRERGSIMVGAGLGRVGLFVQPYHNSTQSYISFYPQAGYFIQDNLLVGTGLNFSYSSSSGHSGSFGVDPFLRRYFSGTTHKSSFFVEAQLGYSGERHWGNPDRTYKYRYFSASVGPGFAWFLNPYVSFESILRLQSNVSSTSSATYGANMNFGFQIYMPAKKAVKALKISDAEQPTAVSSQRERGGKLVGIGLGNAGAYVQPYVNSGIGLSLNPSVGYFVRDNFALGGTVNLGYVESINNGHAFSYGVQPFVRSYFSKTKRKTSWFFDAQVGISGTRYRGGDGNISSGYVVTAAPGLGFAYFINPYVSFESVLKAQAYSFEFDDDILLYPSVNFGFQVYLPGKKVNSIEPLKSE